MRKASRSDMAMLAASLVLLAMGTVSVAVNLPYLPDGGGWDAGVPWVAAGCGVVGFACGLWCLAQFWRTSEVTGLVLRSGGGLTFGVIMLGVCIALLLAGLTVSQPSVSTGLPSLIAFNFIRSLFTPRRDVTPPPQPTAGQRGNTGR